MEHNPYAPPKAAVDGLGAASAGGVPAPVEVLYSPNQIAVATFLGTPIAAAWLAARNFRAMGQAQEVGRTWGFGILLTVVVFAVSTVLPDRVPNSVLPVAYCLALRALAESKFKSVIDAHISAGGSLGSWWRVVGIGILCLLIVVVVMIAVMFLVFQ